MSTANIVSLTTIPCDVSPMAMGSPDSVYDILDQISIEVHKEHLTSDLIPMTGMKEKLIEGIEFLDVGCGSGFHACELARTFPKSTFIGIDQAETVIEKANERKTQFLLPNVTFLQQNAKSMDPSWTEKFDMVMIFDACHDQCRPDLAIKEIYRVLKPSGLFAMVEIDGTPRGKTGMLDAFAPVASAFCTASVLNSLAPGSNSEDALGMGTMIEAKRGKELLLDAGFNDVKVQKIPFLDSNVLYLARK